VGIISFLTLLSIQDVNVYVSEPQAAIVQFYYLRPQRQIYFICIEGRIQVNGVWLSTRDAARIATSLKSSTEIRMEAGEKGAHL
jgi:hypothetical protein